MEAEACKSESVSTHRKFEGVTIYLKQVHTVLPGLLFSQSSLVISESSTVLTFYSKPIRKSHGGKEPIHSRQVKIWNRVCHAACKLRLFTEEGLMNSVVNSEATKRKNHGKNSICSWT